MREKLDEQDFAEMRNFHPGKDTVERVRSRATDRERVFAKTHLMKDTYKELTVQREDKQPN